VSVANINEAKTQSEFNKLIQRFASDLANIKTSSGFKAITVYKGWEADVNSWIIRKLDQQAYKNNDHIIISDIQYKLPNRLSISYLSYYDYDDLIDELAKL
jgi:heme-degrading monooxygenase HmoA